MRELFKQEKIVEKVTYKETIDYLYNAAPAFTKVGAVAYKEGLYNTEELDRHAGHPHRSFLTVHVAGTNGKGSCSHSLAAILQAAGMKVGLYTSPHLVTFRERVRVNGEMMPEEYVVDWVERNRSFFEPLSPSFFELTTAMAFEYFRDQKVDIAIVEVGLGGRLDCTNIITPVLSVITNISFDHTQFLGSTLHDIAREKAGIIKKGVPVVVGETVAETREVFQEVAERLCTPLSFAEDSKIPLDVNFQLKGSYQKNNLNTILHCLLPLARELKKRGVRIPNATKTVRYALEHVCDLTGLRGRWQTVGEKPLVICDTGHNVAGWEFLAKQITETWKQRALQFKKQGMDSRLRMVFGMVDDKDLDTVLGLLPKNAEMYFTQADTHRAILADVVREKSATLGLFGRPYPTVAKAFEAALADSSPADFIFVGGSSYVVADFLSSRK